MGIKPIAIGGSFASTFLQPKQLPEKKLPLQGAGGLN
jgi:hypothetical protein